MLHQTTATADEILHMALEVVRRPQGAILSALDDIPAAIYVTDAEGVITYFNRACIAFAGRTPILGQDRWCVTWKLYTDAGEFLPHDQCPMAEAIRTRRPVRGVTAVVERPDGSRVNMLPHPTPLLGETGELLGAINMLIDVTDRKQASLLRQQASRCRRLAGGVGGDRAADTLTRMAEEYERKALDLDVGV